MVELEEDKARGDKKKQAEREVSAEHKKKKSYSPYVNLGLYMAFKTHDNVWFMGIVFINIYIP